METGASRTTPSLHCLMLLSLLLTAVACRASRFECDSANGSNVVFSGMRGHLVSDTDGAGPNPMSNDVFCVWFIQCPADTTVYFPLIFLNSAFHNTRLRVYNDSPVAGVLLQSYHGHRETGYSRSYGGVETNSVKLVFSSESSRNAVQRGLELRWVCRIGNCISPNATGAVFPGPRGRIVSDVNVPSGENCSWTVKCLDSESFMVTSTNWDLIEIYNAENGMLLSDNRGRSKSSGTELMNASSVRIAYSTSYDGYDGFVLDYQCVLRACEPASLDATLQNCTFMLPSLCSGHGVFEVEEVSFLGNILINATTKLYLSAEGVQPVVYTPDGWSSGIGTFRTNTVAVSFVTPYADDHQNNFILRFRSCKTSQCLALNATRQMFSANSGFLQKLTGINSNGVPQSCFWRISCLSPEQRIILDYHECLGSSAFLHFSTTSGAMLEKFHITSGSNFQTYQNTIDIRYTDPANPGYANAQNFYDNNSFRVEWRCTTGNPSSVKAIGTVLQDTASRLVSGTDGFNSSSFTMPKQGCAWFVECPVGYVFTVPSQSVSEHSLFYDTSLFITDAANTTATVLYLSGEVGKEVLFTDSRFVMIEFQIGPSKYSHYGPITKDYGCRSPACSADATDTATNHHLIFGVGAGAGIVVLLLMVFITVLRRNILGARKARIVTNLRVSQL